MNQEKKAESLNKLSEILSDWYMSNDVDVYDLMFFLASSMASIIAQEKGDYEYEVLMNDLKRMVEIVKSETPVENHPTITSQK